MNTTNAAIQSPTRSALGNPWTQLILGIICMVMVANYQYGWTLFVGPIHDKYGWTKAQIQVAFTIFVLLETWLVPLEGWLVDRFGPRWIIAIGGALCAIAWTIDASASTRGVLYFASAIAGIGAGAVYGTCIGNAVKWFPDRRGLAAGLTAAGFGAGSAATIIPIANMIKSSGYQHTFLVFGLFQGIVVFIIAFFILIPPAEILNRAVKLEKAPPLRHQAQPQEMLKTPVFWVMYIMFVLMAVGGLMATAQLAPIATDFKVDKIPVSLIGITLPALTFALALDRILNGLCRPFFGWVSDHIGRENTMLIAFALEGFGIIALATYGTNPVAFVILSGCVFFAWGEIYSLFPATTADTFGSRFATVNTGLMYTAKGTASLLVPVANIMANSSSGWHGVFIAAAVMNFIAAAMAIVVLKPMRVRYAARTAPLQAGPATATAG